MPRGGPRINSGGARPGAGRPRKEPLKVAPDILAAARSVRMLPLDYMLAVMNNEDADLGRRDRMAQAAAPYVHAKPLPADTGKKATAQEAAETAGTGSAWGDDLAFLAPN